MLMNCKYTLICNIICISLEILKINEILLTLQKSKNAVQYFRYTY